MNFKKIVFAGLALCIAVSASAVPARRGIRSFTRPDGGIIELQMVGDEFFHTLATPDGKAVGRGSDGYFYYRNADGLTTVRVNAAESRTPAENIFLQSDPRVNVEDLLKDSKKRVSGRRAAARGPKKVGNRQVPCIGSPRIPVLLVQFKDYKFKDQDPKKTFNEFFSTGDISARQYFIDQSNGKYSPDFEVFGPVTLMGNRASYGGNDIDGNDVGVGRMVSEGCFMLNSQVDFSRYDNDGDGECDVLIVLYAGDGEASSMEEDSEDAVWPCQWALSSSDYGSSLNLDGTVVDRFAVFNELNGRDLSRIDGIGTFCHEFSHCLDLPDFYDTDYGNHFGMADWSLLDYGCYNGDGYLPIGYSAYEKEFMGWIEIEEAKADTYYTLPVFNQKNIATDKAVKLTNSADPDEYFIIENRANQGWDTYMPAEGLLITHVTYDAYAWENNEVNNYSLQRMTPVPADGNLKMIREYYQEKEYWSVDSDDLVGDLWPWGGNDAFTDTSNPAAKVNTGKLLGKPVTSIERNEDGTISFWAMKAPKPAVAAPLITGGERPDPTSMTINWKAGDSSDVSYTLEVREHREVSSELVEKASFDREDHGWEPTGYTSIEEGAIRLGSGKQLGTITSPAFSTDGQNVVTVLFKAKYYSADGSSVKVSLVDAGNRVISSETVFLTSQFDNYAVVLDVPSDGEVSVRFEILAIKKRVYIASAEIYTGDASNEGYRQAPMSVLTFKDIRATSYTVTGLTENVYYDFRVKAVPDEDTMDESAWSPTLTLLVCDPLGVDGISAEDDVAEYYTMQGVRVGRTVPGSGLYIEVRGSKTRKIMIK